MGISKNELLNQIDKDLELFKNDTYIVKNLLYIKALTICFLNET